MVSAQYARLLEKGFDEVGECLISRGTKYKTGYALVSVNKKHSLAHRVTYREWWGAIPTGLVIDHICHNQAATLGLCQGGNDCPHRACVNPGHLEAKTSQENFNASPLGAKWNQRGPYLEKCWRGHLFSEENTYWPPYGSRQCKECRRIALRESRKRRKG